MGEGEGMRTGRDPPRKKASTELQRAPCVTANTEFETLFQRL